MKKCSVCELSLADYRVLDFMIESGRTVYYCLEHHPLRMNDETTSS